jgi:Zn finger protein HypA/HybF involved in hydrogenase expression
MRQMLSYGDTDTMDSFDMKSIHAMGRQESLSDRVPMPGTRRLKVICLECEKKFTSASYIPTCPGCGGSDVELA